MPAPTAEIGLKPQEAAKPAEPSEKKGTPVSAKFQKAKAKFTAFTGGIQQAFTNLTKQSSHIIFDAEQHELAQLNEKFAQTNQEIATKLGISPEGVSTLEGKVLPPEAKVDMPPSQDAATIQQQVETTSAQIQTQHDEVASAVQAQTISEAPAKEAEPKERKLQQVGDRQGTNEGGFYQDEATGEFMYVKFYNDINQGRMEVIANNVYRKLGIPATESEIVIVDGKLAFASKVIEGHQREDVATLKSDQDVRSGFVADAFLANWDVVGLVYDNVERGIDGRSYRIDNGGTLTYRAQGGIKQYPADTVGELDTLRNPSINPQSAEVFTGMTEEEIRTQAQRLVHTLTEQSIDEIVNQSGLPEDLTEVVRKGMKGRRKVLMERFQLEGEEQRQDARMETSDPRMRTTKTLQELQDRAKARELERTYVTKGMLGDSDKIEGHQIDFIHQGERTAVSFKMTSAMAEKVKNEVIPTISSDAIATGRYEFQSPDGRTESISDCWIVRIDENTRVYISKGEEANGQVKSYDYDKPIKDAQGYIVDYEYTTVPINIEPVRALMGTVKIEVQGLSDAPQIAERIDTAFQGLKIAEALVTPDQQAQNQYREARYRWQHRLEDEQAWQAYKEQYKAEHDSELVDHLQRQEVFPEYSTVVDKGASERYQRDGKLFLLHSVYNEDNLGSILQNGLLSSHERFKRGILTTGMSTVKDFETGGADSVFIRSFPESAGDQEAVFFQPHLLINAQTLDRTDWYAYGRDAYGTTNPRDFDARPSPEQFFSAQRQYFNSTNEIMMRRGIPPEMISGVVVPNEYEKGDVVGSLQAAGIQEVNGVPLDQFITISEDFGALKKAQGIVDEKKEVPV